MLPNHALRFGGLRFESRETERQYREWRMASATPFARIGYVGSTPSWLLVLLSVVALDRDSVGETAAWVGAWITFLLLLTALTVPESLRRTVIPLAAIANCAAGFLIVWLMSHVVLNDASVESRAGLTTAGLIVVMFFGFAIFRIPPGLALAAVTPYVAFGSFRMLHMHQNEGLDSVEAGALAAAQ